MISFPHAKINLGLQVLRRRADGFHDIASIFYPIPLWDILEIIPFPGKEIHFSSSGMTIPGKPEENLCIKAYHLLKKDFPHIPSIAIHLHKMVPPGAGLGGGSSDAAFTLQMINKQYKLSVATEKLQDYAASLGSDCPFFILNKPCYATGRGEILKPLSLNLCDYTIVIVNPGIHIGTKEAFEGINPEPASASLEETASANPSTWKNAMKNDFEKPIFSRYPAIKNIKEELYRAGAVYASMSGSGSTVYGIFSQAHPPLPFFPSHYFIKYLHGQVK